ncbi:MAG: PEP-CTERM sorting domain-containing protein [Verrucomicrobiae bacterium]|nr:PEP-CTERM sorting domain-containing protein [Verrucomicrobiae bacterium]
MKTNLRRSWKTIGAACVTAGLVSTWDTPADAQGYSFTGSITPTHDLSDVYFIFAIGNCSGGGTYAQKISDFIAANTTDNFNLTFNNIPDGLQNNGQRGYAIAGLYDPVNGGVSLSYDANQGANLLAVSPAPSWDGYWLPTSNDGNGYSIMSFAYEADIAAALSGGSVPFTPLGTPFPGVSTDPSSPSSFTLINFSSPANGGGGFIVEVVPEPATISSLAIGTALLSLGWLRRRKTA